MPKHCQQLARLVSVTAVLVFAGGLEAAPIEHKPRGPRTPPENCPVFINFFSQGRADIWTLERVIEHIEASSKIDRATVQPWGLEGEHEVCVYPKAQHLDDEFEALKALVENAVQRSQASIKRWSGNPASR